MTTKGVEYEMTPELAEEIAETLDGLEPADPKAPNVIRDALKKMREQAATRS